MTLHLEGGTRRAMGPVSSDSLLLGRQAAACASGAAQVCVFSSLSTRDAACSQTSTQGGCCHRTQGTTHRLLCALRGDGSNAAGTRWHFAGNACGGSPIPGKERSSDSPHTSLLTLCKRCSCPGMQCLAYVGVRKGKAAVFPGSSKSTQPEKIALLANFEVKREFL